MKIQVYNWAGSSRASELLDVLGYKHQGFYEVENIFHVVERMHATGLNVMLPVASDGIQLIAVDFERMFSQR